LHCSLGIHLTLSSSVTRATLLALRLKAFFQTKLLEASRL
jgi:hypothetical protein